MKKLFNYALLAAALLVGVNVNADEVSVSTFGDLKTAIEEAAGERTITILSPVTGESDITIGNGQSIKIELNGQVITNSYSFVINHGSLEFSGKGTVTGLGYAANVTLIKIKGSQTPTDANYSVLKIGKDVNVIRTEGYALGILNNDKCAYGAVIENSGYVKGQAGELSKQKGWNYCALTVNGNINKTTGCIPVITLYKEGSFVGDGGGIYGAGYAIWNLYGYVEGDYGIYIKSGQWNIDGATIVATATTHTDVVVNNSGTSGGEGTGIVIDSHSGYGKIGNIEIANTVVISSATGGYAIEEVATQGGTKLPDISIESGTFVGGITTTTEERQHIIDSGSITGGEWHNSDIDEYIDKDNYTTLDFVDGEGKQYQIVVPIKEADWSQSIVDAAAQTDKPKYAKVIADEDVNTDTKVEFVRILAGKKVTVKSGATLDAGTLMTEGTAQIIVEAGGTLIISGEQGAYTFDENSLVVETSEANPGIVLINPAVVLNTTPKATVKFISKSYRNNADDKQFQYFGTPMVGEVKSIKPDKSVQTSIELWNAANWEWNSLGILNADGTGLDMSKFNAPFGFYNMLANTPNTTDDYQVTYTITGNLIGNTTPEINLPAKWNSMANSYSGKIGTQALLDALKVENGLGKSVYTYTKQGAYLMWRAVNELNMKNLKLIPMAAFMLVNNTADNKVISLDYNNLVWTPATTPAVPGAPKANQFAKATINVNGENMGDVITVAEDGQFSSDFEDGYDAEKFDNKVIKFYVNANGEYDIYATDNLNNTFVGFNTTKAGKYTISFEDVTGNFALVDMMTNARIEMVEGNTYEFLAEAGEDAYRFQIVTGAKAPTEMQKTNAAVKATRALINGQIVISNGERFFNVLGAEVK